jgi:hypothetical protein
VARGILEYFKKQGSSQKFCGLRLDYKEAEGPLCKFPGIIDFWIYFSMENLVDWVHSAWTESTVHGPGSAARVHHGPRRCGQECMAAPCRGAARGRWRLPVLADGSGGGRGGARGVLTKA